MNNPLPFKSPPVVGRERSTPWYLDRLLVGAVDGVDNEGNPVPALARVLPGDVFLPRHYVAAVAEQAVALARPIDVSWIEMGVVKSLSVPVQHHRESMAVWWIGDDLEAFGAAGGGDMEAVCIPTDCVTDIRLLLFYEPPQPDPVDEDEERSRWEAAREQQRWEKAEARRQAKLEDALRDALLEDDLEEIEHPWVQVPT